MKINEADKHYYLYAKGWYQKSDDIVKDLLTIHEEWCGCDLDIGDVGLIEWKLTDIAFDIMMNSPKDKRDFFHGFIYSLKTDKDLIVQCLRLMRYCSVENLSSDDVNENILPLKENNVC